MARGRDATDVAIVTKFGPCKLASFKVVTDEMPEKRPRRVSSHVCYKSGNSLWSRSSAG